MIILQAKQQTKSINTILKSKGCGTKKETCCEKFKKKGVNCKRCPLV